MEKPVYQFEGVELDTARRQLRTADKARDLPPLVFGLLEHLAKHGNEVVSKDELSAALWPGRIVTEASISQAVRKARAALEDCGVDPAIIRTRHGHGYRLDAAVSVGGRRAGRTEWREHPFRTGAIVALLGGTLVTVANITDILSMILPDDSVQLLEETQTVIQSTDAKVDELVRLMREQASRKGLGLDLDAENTIRDALRLIVDSVDARKQTALDRLVAGDVDGAAAAIVAVAQDLDTASEQSIDAAALSWREAGAIYYGTNVAEAVRSFESAYRLRPDDPRNALDLAYAYIRAERLDDALALFEALIASAAPPGSEATALRGAAIVRKMRGEYDGAAALLERAMSTAREAGDRREQGKIRLQRGAIARARGDNALAREEFETAVDMAEEIGDQPFLAESLNGLGVVMAVTGDFAPAIAALSRAYDIHSARQDLAGQSTTLGNLGATALSQGDAEAAEGYLLESVAIGERLGWQRSIALDLINLGTIAASRQEFDAAAGHLTRALDIAVTAQLDEIHPIILVNMGEVARERNDKGEACRLWNDALPRLQAMRHSAAEIVSGYLNDLDCPPGAGDGVAEQP